MKSNQSLHLTVKQPPNDQPIKSLGIFSSLNDESIMTIIQSFLSEITAEEKDTTFTQNVREEAIKVILAGEVISVSRNQGILIIHVRERPT
jgi:uncharacterized protein YqhQ